MQYFIKRGEKVQGPFTREQLMGFAKAKKVTGTDWVGNTAEGPFQELKTVWELIKTPPAEPASSEPVQQAIEADSPASVPVVQERFKGPVIDTGRAAPAIQPGPPALPTPANPKSKNKFLLFGGIAGGAGLLVTVVIVIATSQGGNSVQSFAKTGKQIYEKFEKLLEVAKELKAANTASRQASNSSVTGNDLSSTIAQTDRLLDASRRVSSAMANTKKVRQELQALLEKVDKKDWDKPLTPETKITTRDLYDENKSALAKYGPSVSAVTSSKRSSQVNVTNKPEPQRVVENELTQILQNVQPTAAAANERSSKINAALEKIQSEADRFQRGDFTQEEKEHLKSIRRELAKRDAKSVQPDVKFETAAASLGRAVFDSIKNNDFEKFKRNAVLTEEEFVLF
ncbi:MAG: hypothetical protein VX438_01970, partial [Planctomycetota bacterium]|nr:hypothetical protein [Planctomycetota bacterium]